MKLNNMNIGGRLALGFGAILVIALAAILVGVFNLRQVAAATRAASELPLAKERLVSDWYRNTFGSIVRTTALMRSTDPALPALLAPDAAATTKLVSELQKTVEPLLGSEAEKAAFKRVGEVRKAYIAARQASADARKAGDEAGAAVIVEKRFLPLAAQYAEGLRALLQMQRDSLDTINRSIETLYQSALRQLLILGVLLLALGAACGVLIARSITRPLQVAVALAQRVAEGDLSADITVDARDETGRLMLALKEMNGSLLRVVTEVRGGTDSIATASSQIAAGNLDLSSRTEEQAGALEETASSMEEMTSTVRQNAENARQASQMAASASNVARRGGAIVAQVVDTMGQINAASGKIVDIISVIDGIAFQTNILALNAAVEAARAGEQGRGFAVVASEVRNLAQRSAAAAKEIKQLIGASVEQVALGSSLVGNAGDTMQEIVASVQRVTDVIAEISAASGEQEDGIFQINQAIGQMDAVTQQNAALVEEAAAAAESLQNQAERLAAVVAVFKLSAVAGPRPRSAGRADAAGTARSALAA